MSDDDGAKWACEYCTYQNYASALRCTMCAGGKPLFNEDIYRLSPSRLPAAATSSSDILSYRQPQTQQQQPIISTKPARSKTPTPPPSTAATQQQPKPASPPSTLSPMTTPMKPQQQNHHQQQQQQQQQQQSTLPTPNKSPTKNIGTTQPPTTDETQTIAAATADVSIANTMPPIVDVHNSASIAEMCPVPSTAHSPTSTQNDQCSNTAASSISSSIAPTLPATSASSSSTRHSEALHNNMNDQLRALSLRNNTSASIVAAAAGSDTDLSNSTNQAPNRQRRRRLSGDATAATAATAGTAATATSNHNTAGSPSASASNLLYDSRTTAAAAPSTKWSCTLCTYENYPKSLKCSMCAHARELPTATSAEQLMSNSLLICSQAAGGGGGGGLTPPPPDEMSTSAGAGAVGNSPSPASPERGDSGDDSANNCASNFIISSGTLYRQQQQQQQQHNHNNHHHQQQQHNNQHQHNNNQQQQQQHQQQRNNHNRYQLIATGATSPTNNSATPENIGSTVAAAAATSSNNCDILQERRYRHMRRQDWQWLHACVGVVENNYAAVESYLSCGGNPGRSLTASEVALLNRNSAFDVGHTLIHLAIRFHREEMLPILLTQIHGSGPGIKRVPSYVAPDLAADIRRHFANSLRCRKAAFACHYVGEHATFALPAEIEELPNAIQDQLHDELLDRDAQAQLECSPPALNWSLEITVRLGSRLSVLWNRSAGDCLLDSAMQATWGVFDRDNVLRRALAESLHQCGHMFFARWKEYEMAQAALLDFTLEDAQWEEDWTTLLSLARQPGAALEQLHIFALAHILRRPIVVYGVKYVKSFRGEDIGFARFEGLYLPLLWDQSFCSKSPIALGYTRGHFSALVPVEPYTRIDAACVDAEDVLFLPLMDCEHKLLPIRFLTHSEMGREESIMRQWLDVCVTEGGLLVAQQKLQKRPLLVAQMLEEWLNHYRRIAQVVSGPFNRRRALNHAGYSSDGDTDEE